MRARAGSPRETVFAVRGRDPHPAASPREITVRPLAHGLRGKSTWFTVQYQSQTYQPHSGHASLVHAGACRTLSAVTERVSCKSAENTVCARKQDPAPPRGLAALHERRCHRARAPARHSCIWSHVCSAHQPVSMGSEGEMEEAGAAKYSVKSGGEAGFHGFEARVAHGR